MDKYKREALYYLGNALEMVGKNSEAVDYYRQILLSMPGYRDVNQRVKAINDAAASEK